MAQVISFINYKGGVGKTTTAYHIGCALALYHGKRVLMIDVDPQTNLTFLCASAERWERFRTSNGTLASLYKARLLKQTLPIDSIVWKEPIERAGVPAVPGLDLIPSDVELMGIDLDLQSSAVRFQDLDRAARGYLAIRTMLRNAIAPLREQYDFILLDCPPNLYLVTQNALAASDAYVVTALPDHLSTVGLSMLNQRVGGLVNKLSAAAQIVGKTVNGCELGGILFVRVRIGGQSILAMHRRIIEQIMRTYPGKAFPHYTIEGIGYGEAAEQALPVYLVESQNCRRVASQYAEITNDFVRRF